MQATADDLDLSPPADRGGWAPWALALLAHGLLALALAWGLAWQRETAVVATAELWSSIPQVAAPRAQEPPPPPPAPPQPAPRPATPPPAAEPAHRDADIAVQRQREEQHRREAEARRLAEARAAQEKAQREKAEREKAARERAEREKAQREQAAKAAREQAARDKAAQEKAARERAERERAQMEAERQRNLERILGQANATGGPGARGTAERDAGPSASYAGKLVAHIRPNIVFTGSVPGNPRAEVEVRALPDGTILSSRLIQSSGHRAWDDAVLRAIERTARLPRDENGRVPPTLILGFRPQE